MRSKPKPRLHGGRSGAAILLEVVYGAKSDRLLKKRGDEALVLEITNQEDGHASNQTILEFLALAFQIPLKDIQVIDGSDQNKKLIGIFGIDSDGLQSKLDSLLP